MKRREAIEIVREYYPSSGKDLNEALETLIPELKESEDEMIRKDCIKYLDWEYQHCSTNEDKIKIEKCIAWLEKQGSQKLANSEKTCKIEQKPAWSEEDEKMYTATIFALAGFMGNGDKLEWLKSLKDRYTWKPSDEQMEYLAKAITTLGNEGDNKTSAILCELRTDLKKLKG